MSCQSATLSCRKISNANGNSGVYKIDQSTVDVQMSAAIRKHHFFTLWKNNASRDEFFECVNKVRKTCNLPLYTREKFEEGWQYRVVLHEKYDVARDEFFNLCFGWW